MNIDNINELLRWLQNEVLRAKRQLVVLERSRSVNNNHQTAFNNIEAHVANNFYRGPYRNATMHDEKFIDANDFKASIDNEWEMHIKNVRAREASSIKTRLEDRNSNVSNKEPTFQLQDNYGRLRAVKAQDGSYEVFDDVDDKKLTEDVEKTAVASSSSSATWVGSTGKKAPKCQICRRRFHIFSSKNRRHHCRLCGKAVCNDCSPHIMQVSNPLTKKGGTGEAAEVRVCKLCMHQEKTKLRYKQIRPYSVFSNDEVRDIRSRAQIIVRHGHGAVLHSKLHACFVHFMDKNPAAQGFVQAFKVFSSAMGKGRSDCAVIYFHDSLNSPNVINFFKSLNPRSDEKRNDAWEAAQYLLPDTIKAKIAKKEKFESGRGFFPPLSVNPDVELPGFFPMRGADGSTVAWGMPIPVTVDAQRYLNPNQTNFTSAGGLIGQILGKAVVNYICEYANKNPMVYGRPFELGMKFVISELLHNLYPGGLPTTTHLHHKWAVLPRGARAHPRYSAQLPVTNYTAWEE